MTLPPNLSLVIPAFRTPKWNALIESLEDACQHWSWEAIFISPFALPDEIKDWDNIKVIKSYSTVPVCLQMGVLEAKGEYIFSTTDDGVFAPDSIDLAMDLISKEENNGNRTVLSMAYGEGGNLMDREKYWTAWTYPELRFPSIKPEWKMAQQFLMKRELFIESGGYDCLNFEYQDAAVKDLIFRLQNDGVKVLMSPKHCLIASWMPGETGDHSPIHNAQVGHDEPIFNAMYSDPFVLENREIEYDNWRLAPQIWERRFGKIETAEDIDRLPKSYKQLCEEKGYKVE